jgi:hypothetical protein
MPVTQIDIMEWHVEVDADVTAHAYERLTVGCDCVYCRNFLAALHHLPAEFHQLLQLLGINPAIPAEVVEYHQNPNGSHSYSWWYHANGRILSDQHAEQNHFGHSPLTPAIDISISTKTDLVAPDFPYPILQIEFFTNLPWLLEESAERNN